MMEKRGWGDRDIDPLWKHGPVIMESKVGGVAFPCLDFCGLTDSHRNPEKEKSEIK